jgi:hypothetical protein
VTDLLQVSHVPERIEQYREAMREGHRFPPISVVEVAGRLFIADGHKRFSAYKGLLVDEIVVEVWTTRRWLADQWRQFTGKTRQQWVLVTRSLVDRRARAQGVRLFWDSLGHWRRIALSVKGPLARFWTRARSGDLPAFKQSGNGAE